MKFPIQICLGCSLLLGVSLPSFASDSKIEDAIKYRQAVYKVIAWNIGPMGAMAKGKIPYDAEVFAKNAKRMAVMSEMSLEGFIPGSDKGFGTEAKPEIWENWEDFTAKMQDMEEATKRLAEIAEQGDFNAAKKQLGATGKTCKSCHDEYRLD